MRSLAHLAILVALGLTAGPEGAAQLISPGPLTRAHAHLEGITSCTSCHTLGQRGVDAAKCLNCHTPIQARLARAEGYHATVSRDCGSCHRDHAGRDFDPVRLDPERFDHRRTGYPLVGAHAEASCRSCHRPRFVTDADVRAFSSAAGRLDQTYLGVADDCATCHRAETPHGTGPAVTDCGTCHTPARWDAPRPFDHAATGFALTGAHTGASCTICHAPQGDGLRFDGAGSACRSCHAAADPHGTQFRGRDCASCHATDTWRSAPRLDHARARFPLTGQHRRASCASCHGPMSGRTTFVGTMAFASCADCHQDPHADALGNDCATCHTTEGWRQMGRTFAADRFDHATTGFALVGAHAETACASCHSPRRDDRIQLQFARTPSGATFPPPIAEACASCHVDAHRGAFRDRPGAGACDACHGSGAWTPTTFGLERHATETAFPLTGGHAATPCFACHGGTTASPHLTFQTSPDGLPDCETCHAARNPHGVQFAGPSGETACGSCHTTSGWGSATFDHARTGFPLVGAHAAVSCTSCHGEGQRTFGGLDPTCASCHADPHQSQFAGRDCATCHDAQAFTMRTFDHRSTAFPLVGAHAAVACASCHRAETAPDGSRFIRFRPLETTCAACHGTAR